MWFTRVAEPNEALVDAQSRDSVIGRRCAEQLGDPTKEGDDA